MSSRAAQEKHRGVVQHKRYLSVGDGFNSSVSVGRFLTLVSVSRLLLYFLLHLFIIFRPFSPLKRESEPFCQRKRPSDENRSASSSQASRFVCQQPTGSKRAADEAKLLLPTIHL